MKLFEAQRAKAVGNCDAQNYLFHSYKQRNYNTYCLKRMAECYAPDIPNNTRHT